MDQLNTAFQIQFLHDVGTMQLNGFDTQVQLLGYPACPKALANESEHGQLTVTQALYG